MRLDFNQKGSWKHALTFDERDQVFIEEDAAKLASTVECKARIIGEIGEVVSYFEPGRGWYKPERQVKA